MTPPQTQPDSGRAESNPPKPSPDLLDELIDAGQAISAKGPDASDASRVENRNHIESAKGRKGSDPSEVQTRELIDRLILALAAYPGDLYEHRHRLCRVLVDEEGRPAIVPVKVTTLREQLEVAVESWRAEHETEIRVTAEQWTWAPRHLHDRGHWPGVPRLRRVITRPMALPDGETRRGYDSRTGILYLPHVEVSWWTPLALDAEEQDEIDGEERDVLETLWAAVAAIQDGAPLFTGKTRRRSDLDVENRRWDIEWLIGLEWEHDGRLRRAASYLARLCGVREKDVTIARVRTLLHQRLYGRRIGRYTLRYLDKPSPQEVDRDSGRPRRRAKWTIDVAPEPTACVPDADEMIAILGGA